MKKNNLWWFDCIQVVPDKIPPCVYFLIDRDDEIVYVGQSTHLESRLIQHREWKGGKQVKSFKTVFYIPTDVKLLTFTELAFIRMFKPKFNKSRIKSIKYLEEILRIMDGERIVFYHQNDVSRFRSALSRFGIKITQRKESNGIRVWRTE